MTAIAPLLLGPNSIFCSWQLFLNWTACFALYLDQWNVSQLFGGIFPITDSICCTSSWKVELKIPPATENVHPCLSVHVETRPVQLLRHLLRSVISYNFKLWPQLMDQCISLNFTEGYNALLPVHKTEVISVFQFSSCIQNSLIPIK